MRIPTLIIALLVLSANAFADDQTDPAAYCQYVTEQAVAAVDLLRTPAIVSGVTQPTTANQPILDATMIGISSSSYSPPLVSPHADIVVVAFCDGHVESVPNDTICMVSGYLATP